MALGAVAVVAGLAAPAAAHEGKEPDKVQGNQTCASLAEYYGIEGVEWTQSKIESGNLPSEGESATYELVAGDDLTPGYEGDGPSITITMRDELKNFDWESTEGIDAVFVKGGEHHGSHFYGYQPEVAGYNEPGAGTVVGEGEEATSDVDLSSPPYGRPEGQISHVTLCWDGEGSGTTSTTAPPTSECPDVSISSRNTGDENPPYEETPPSSECDTTTTTPTTTPPSTDAPTTTLPIDTESTTTVVDNSVVPSETTTTVEITPEGSLPNTGSSSTTPLIVGGLALLALGGGLVAGKRWLRRA
jgi:LPXTG-motif cell wall-anchored protein